MGIASRLGSWAGCGQGAKRAADTFVATQGDYVRDGWNITGDVYAQDADGYFQYQARTDDMIVSSGYNIAGPEVEEALLRHPDVAETAVVGVPDEDRGMIVKAVVVLRPGAELGAEPAKTLQLRQTSSPLKYPA